MGVSPEKLMQLNNFDYRIARLAAGVTLGEVAQILGVTESMVSKWESGSRRLSAEQGLRLRAYLIAALRRKATEARALADSLAQPEKALQPF